MFEQLLSSSLVRISLAVIGGIIIGGICIEAFRRARFFPSIPQWNILAYGGSMLLGGTLLGGCVLLFGGGGAPPFTPPTQFIPSATPTTMIQTLTPSVPPPLTRVPDIPLTTPSPITKTVTATLTVTPRPMPSSFDITLLASDEKLCQKKNFQAPYRVTIQGTTMTLLQVNANIATVGTYTPATGAFTTTKTGLPGTEIYTGTLTFDGTTIKVLGTYTYINDPNVKCVGLWVISGQQVVQ